MVYGKKIPVFDIKVSPAFGADQTVYFQRLFSVIGVSGGAIL
jgi:hypothetical protein